MLSLYFVEITGRQQLKADITHHVQVTLKSALHASKLYYAVSSTSVF